MRISMESGGTQTTLNLLDAITKRDYDQNQSYRNTVKFYKNDIATMLGYDYYTDDRLRGEVTDTILLEMRGFYGSQTIPYKVLHRKLKFVLELPKYTDSNGNTHYMTLEKISGPDKEYRYTLTEDPTNGTVTIEYDNLYLGSYIVGRLHLKFPDIPDLEKKKYPFKGTLRMYHNGVEVIQYNSEFVNGVKVPRTSFTLYLDNEASADLVSYVPNDPINVCSVPAEYPNALGKFYLHNQGSRDSGKVTVNMEFNAKNASGTPSAVRLGVTTVVLMADPKTNPMVVHYTLMDESGAVIDNNGSPFTVEVPHNYTKYVQNQGVQLNRGMLPEAHQKYFFNSISYDISNIPAGFLYNTQTDPLRLGYPGAFYGYYLGEELTADVYNYTRCTVLDSEGTEIESVRKFSSALVRPRNKRRSVIYITGCSFSAKEINAGESFTVTSTSFTDSYPYGSVQYVDEVRFGIILPDSAVINEDSIKLTLYDINKPIPMESLTKESIGAGRNLWTIQIPKGYCVGYQTEDLKKLSNGSRVQVKFQVNTSVTALEETLYSGDILLVSAKGIESRSISKLDKYDFNGNGSTSDNIGAVASGMSQIAITIWAKDHKMEDEEGLLSGGSLSTNVNIYSEDTVTDYQVNIKNVHGGIGNKLAYYVQIPQESLGTATDKMVLAGPGTVTFKSGTKIKLLYTTDTGLTYDNVKSKDSAGAISWSENPTDYSLVTMVKAVTVDGTGFVNGSESSFTLPLAYSGTDYARCAGATAKVSTFASYTYVQGSKSTAYELKSPESTITLNYIATEKQLTLTAALNMQPTAPNIRVDSYATGFSFLNDQSFKVANIKLNNMELGNFTQDQLNADSNRRFKIGVAMNSAAQKILAANVALGDLSANTALSFAFELFNGNALTDITTVRYVTFDLVSDYVTIPVRINIKRELAVAGATESAIKAGKEYLDAGTADTASLGCNSAFTAQFVTPGLNDTNYADRILTFSAKLPSGTTIAMLDYTGANPRYAYYTADGNTSSINLTAFKQMGGTTAYSVNTGSDITEKLIFVVDFSGTPTALGNYTVKLTVKGVGVADAISKELKYTTTAARTFTVSADKTAAKYGESVKLTYKVTDASNDSRYDGRDLSLVVSGSGLPSDASLLVDGKSYYQNLAGQFIIPLTNAQSAGTNSVEFILKSDTLKNNLQSCSLKATVWIAATANGEQPHKGSTVGSVNIAYSAVIPPSLKVASMSDRALNPQDLANDLTLTYTTANIPSGATVTFEVQKLIGAGYVTDSVYVERLTPNSAESAGIYTVGTEGGTLTMKLSQQLEVGNYQVMMSVRKGDTTLLYVPYRFIVTE